MGINKNNRESYLQKIIFADEPSSVAGGNSPGRVGSQQCQTEFRTSSSPEHVLSSRPVDRKLRRHQQDNSARLVGVKIKGKD